MWFPFCRNVLFILHLGGGSTEFGVSPDLSDNSICGAFDCPSPLFGTCWMLNACPPNQAVPELPVSLYICNRSCDIPICKRTFPLSPSLPVHQAELQGLSEAKLIQMRSFWGVFASGGINDFEAWGPGPRREDFVAMFQVSIPPKARGLESNILRGERLQDSSFLSLFRGDLCKWIGSWKQHGCTVSLWFCFFLRKLNNC